jgi:phosphoribosylamine---glycine ligase
MNVLVLGSGGREHALIWALKNTASLPPQLYCAPGNAGIAQIAQCRAIPLTNTSALMEFVQAEEIDLTVVGPEAPLAAGVVDEFENNDLAIVGPRQMASLLESSKAFAKDFMARHGIPTADYCVVNSSAEAADLLRSGRFGPPSARTVVKADGLAAGKGVVVADSRVEAEEGVRMLMSGGLVSAEAAERLVIEQALQGTEASVLLFADGMDYALMPPARDHKRIGEGDTGPNTGGMGAVTDGSVIDPETLNRVVNEIVEPTLAGARAEGFPFRGVLFLGLMLTAEGPMLLEYNVRFGDPEAQAILVRLRTSLVDVFSAIQTERLREIGVEWTDESSACVVLASKGYPGEYKTGARIDGLQSLDEDEYVRVFHAGTSLSEHGEFLTAGGRVLGVTACGETLAAALSHCYRAVDGISWEGMQYRRDIGKFS